MVVVNSILGVEGVLKFYCRAVGIRLRLLEKA